MPGQVLAAADLDGPYDAERSLTQDVATANVITSLVEGTSVAGWAEALHKPVLDIDLPVKVLLSTTPGHHHVLIDKAMPWPVYVDLLEALARAGLIEEGYVRASLARGHTAVRLPWVRKGQVENA